MSLVLKPINTVEVKVEVAIPPENPEIRGYLLCDAVIRSKDEIKDLQTKIEEGEIEGDADLLVNAPAPCDKAGNSIGPKGLYSGIRGLTDCEGKELTNFEDALREVTNGRFSVYLVTALVRKYFAHMSEAPSKNLRKLRGR